MKRTSEDMAGIPEQPAATCPMVNRLIEMIENLGCHPEFHTYFAESAEKEDMIRMAEQIRQNATDLRSWGQGWKDKCQKMMK